MFAVVPKDKTVVLFRQNFVSPIDGTLLTG
jgi:hypothetical protein